MRARGVAALDRGQAVRVKRRAARAGLEARVALDLAGFQRRTG